MSTAGDASRRARIADGRVAEIQRARILQAVVEVVAERGVAGASVELVIARARVSRRTFYGCFAGLEDALVGVLDWGLEQVGSLAVRAFAEQEGSWWGGMRAALAAVLGFFDAQPGLARVCMVEVLAGGAVVLEHRERIVEAFRGLVLERLQGEVSHASPLAAEGLLASVMGVVHARLVAREPEPLIGLLGPLMGILAGSFMDQAGVAREIERGDRLAREMLRERALRASEVAHPGLPVDVPVVLLSARAQRARQCLLYVAQHPGVSNQQVAAGIGASHREQVSRLLARLAGMGLLVKRAGGPGYPNAWSLTAEGEQVACSLAERQ
jgi:AcrR family transcriptional regulator